MTYKKVLKIILMLIMCFSLFGCDFKDDNVDEEKDGINVTYSSIEQEVVVGETIYLERYIGVSGYPTYKIVAPNGNLLPTVVPRPDYPEAIRYMIEEMSNSK